MRRRSIDEFVMVLREKRERERNEREEDENTGAMTGEYAYRSANSRVTKLTLLLLYHMHLCEAVVD